MRIALNHSVFLQLDIDIVINEALDKRASFTINYNRSDSNKLKAHIWALWGMTRSTRDDFFLQAIRFWRQEWETPLYETKSFVESLKKLDADDMVALLETFPS